MSFVARLRRLVTRRRNVDLRPADVKVLELRGLERLDEDCRRTGCRGRVRPTGRLLGREVLHGVIGWYVEVRCARCETLETIGSARIDVLGRDVTSDPAASARYVDAFVEAVRRDGWG